MVSSEETENIGFLVTPCKRSRGGYVPRHIGQYVIKNDCSNPEFVGRKQRVIQIKVGINQFDLTDVVGSWGSAGGFIITNLGTFSKRGMIRAGTTVRRNPFLTVISFVEKGHQVVQNLQEVRNHTRTSVVDCRVLSRMFCLSIVRDFLLPCLPNRMQQF